MGKAYVVFWVNMVTLKVEKVGVYSEASPTQHERNVIPLPYATFHGESYAEASEPARRMLDTLKAEFPELPVGEWETSPASEREVPTFYCGRCKRHIPHHCPAPSEG